MYKKYLIFFGAFVLLILLILSIVFYGYGQKEFGKVLYGSGQKDVGKKSISDYTYIQTIIYLNEEDPNEEGEFIIIRDKRANTAKIKVIFPYDDNEISTPKEFEELVRFSCGILAMIHIPGIDVPKEFEELRTNLSSQFDPTLGTIEDDSPPNERLTVVPDNPLDGYLVTQVSGEYRSKISNKKLADCTVNALSKDTMDLTVY